MSKYLSALFLAPLVGKARGGWILQLLKFCNCILNISQEHIGHIASHTLTHNYAHNDHILNALWHCIGRYHPSALLKYSL